jgi:hypothetical protein
MAETVSRRVRRTPEERVEEINGKIQKHQEAVRVLEKKKHDILHPPKRKTEAQLSRELLLKARKAGLSSRDIARKLGLEQEE